MKTLTAPLLATCMACKLALAERHFPHIQRSIDSYDLIGLNRTSAYLAQVGHESLGLLYKEEIADGSAYEGRLDLGNRFPGDGKLFKGRGWIQGTGRDFYEAYAHYKGISLTAAVQYMMTDEGAADSSAWFWRGMPLGDGRKKKPWDLNTFADLGTWQSFYELSIRINGKSKRTGTVGGMTVNLPNGWEDRCSRWARIWSILE